MATKSFQLGPLIIPVLAGIDAFSHRYEPIGGEEIFRGSLGGGTKQQTWSKTRITTSGAGWLPAGLQQLDYSQSMIMRCITPLAVHSSSAGVVLPASRRADAHHEPWAHAIMPRGHTVPTTLDIVGDLATPGAVAGASGYLIEYFPEYVVWAMRPQQGGDRNTATHSWDLTCEEV